MRTNVHITLLFLGLVSLGLCEVKLIPLSLQSLSLRQQVECPNGGYCPEANTCCKDYQGSYGCCAMPNATCCSDGKHCCPAGNTCGSDGTCVPNLSLGKVYCGGDHYCPDGNTCCLGANGKYGCCPMANAVCCPDHHNCCPHGNVCNMTAGTCDTKQTLWLWGIRLIP